MVPLLWKVGDRLFAQEGRYLHDCLHLQFIENACHIISLPHNITKLRLYLQHNETILSPQLNQDSYAHCGSTELFFFVVRNGAIFRAWDEVGSPFRFPPHERHGLDPHDPAWQVLVVAVAASKRQPPPPNPQWPSPPATRRRGSMIIAQLCASICAWFYSLHSLSIPI